MVPRPVCQKVTSQHCGPAPAEVCLEVPVQQCSPAPTSVPTQVILVYYWLFLIMASDWLILV